MLLCERREEGEKKFRRGVNIGQKGRVEGNRKLGLRLMTCQPSAQVSHIQLVLLFFICLFFFTFPKLNVFYHFIYLVIFIFILLLLIRYELL